MDPAIKQAGQLRQQLQADIAKLLNDYTAIKQAGQLRRQLQADIAKLIIDDIRRQGVEGQ